MNWHPQQVSRGDVTITRAAEADGVSRGLLRWRQCLMALAFLTCFIITQSATGSYLVTDDFENGQGTNNGTWLIDSVNSTWTVDFGYTNNALEGAKSLMMCSEPGAWVTTNIPPQSEVWMYFEWKSLDAIRTMDFAGFDIEATGVDQVKVRTEANWHLTLIHGTASATTVAAVTANTRYHVWLHYRKGTGTNGEASLAFSTSGIKPTSGNNFVALSNGTATVDVPRGWLGVNGSGCPTNLFDHFRISTTEIGDIPDVDPAIVIPPRNRAVIQGSNATFSVTALGTQSLSYQWRFNNTNLAGATTDTYTVTNAQNNNMGDYSVVVTNVAGSVTSSVATLTVNLPGIYLVAEDFESGEGTTCNAWVINLVNSNNPAWTVDFGYTNNALEGARSLMMHCESGAWVATNIAPQSEVWLYFKWMSLNSVSVTEVAGIEANNEGGIRPDQVRVDTDSSAHLKVFNGTVTATTVGTISPNTLYHVWLYYRKGTGGDGLSSVAFSTDGIRPMSGDNFAVVTNGDAALDAAYAWLEAIGTASPTNLYDHVRISATEIGDLTGISPSIDTQPKNQTVTAGGTATFTVTASGTPLLYYQWLFNNTNLAGATTNVCTLSPVLTNQAGSYAVLVANNYGSITSAPASLIVLTGAPPAVSIAMYSGYAGLTISGGVGQICGIQTTTNVGDSNSWQGKTNLTLTTPTQLWLDPQPATPRWRAYRVIAGSVPVP